MASGVNYYNALLGRLYANGTEMPLRGGLNFVGFDITPSSYGYNLQLSAAGGGIPLSALAPASATKHFLMRKSAGGGSWEDGTATDAANALCSATASAGKMPYHDGTSALGATTTFTTNGSTFLGMASLALSSFLSTGATPAGSGGFRGSNGDGYVIRNGANTKDVIACYLDSGNVLKQGYAPTASYVSPSSYTLDLDVAGTSTRFLTVTTSLTTIATAGIACGTGTVAAGGTLRFAKSTTILSTRRSDNNADVATLAVDGVDNFTLGDTNVTTWTYATGAGGTHTFKVNNVLGGVFGSGFLSVGTTPSAVGTIRLPSTGSIYIQGSTDLPVARNVSTVLTIGGGTEGWTGCNLETTTGSVKSRIANSTKTEVTANGTIFTACTAPSTPAAGFGTAWHDSTTKKYTHIDESGVKRTVNGGAVFLFGCATASANQFMKPAHSSLGFAASATELPTTILIPCAGSLSMLEGYAASTSTLTVRKNSADTTLTVTSNNTIVRDNTHVVTVAAGDQITIKTSAGVQCDCSLLFTPSE